MPDFTSEVEVSPWEFIDSCSSHEVKELIEELIDGGHLERYNGKIVPSKEGHGILDMEWEDVITKLKNSKHLLSNEDENIIINIANKLV